MFCSKCGNKSPAGARFCHKCGAKMIVSDVPTSDLSVQPPIAGQPIAGQQLAEFNPQLMGNIQPHHPLQAPTHDNILSQNQNIIGFAGSPMPLAAPVNPTPPPQHMTNMGYQDMTNMGYHVAPMPPMSIEQWQAANNLPPQNPPNQPPQAITDTDSSTTDTDSSHSYVEYMDYTFFPNHPNASETKTDKQVDENTYSIEYPIKPVAQKPPKEETAATTYGTIDGYAYRPAVPNTTAPNITTPSPAATDYSAFTGYPTQVISSDTQANTPQLTPQLPPITNPAWNMSQTAVNPAASGPQMQQAVYSHPVHMLPADQAFPGLQQQQVHNPIVQDRIDSAPIHPVLPNTQPQIQPIYNPNEYQSVISEPPPPLEARPHMGIQLTTMEVQSSIDTQPSMEAQLYANTQHSMEAQPYTSTQHSMEAQPYTSTQHSMEAPQFISMQPLIDRQHHSDRQPITDNQPFAGSHATMDFQPQQPTPITQDHMRVFDESMDFSDLAPQPYQSPAEDTDVLFNSDSDFADYGNTSAEPELFFMNNAEYPDFYTDSDKYADSQRSDYADYQQMNNHNFNDEMGDYDDYSRSNSNGPGAMVTHMPGKRNKTPIIWGLAGLIIIAAIVFVIMFARGSVQPEQLHGTWTPPGPDIGTWVRRMEFNSDGTGRQYYFDEYHRNSMDETPFLWNIEGRNRLTTTLWPDAVATVQVASRGGENTLRYRLEGQDTWIEYRQVRT